jgi:hypothetical protein
MTTHTYKITRREGTDTYTRRPLYWVVITRSDGLQVRSSDWRIDDGSAEAEAQERMTRLEAAGGYAPEALRVAVEAMVPPRTSAVRSDKGPPPDDIHWRVRQLLRAWGNGGDGATVAGVRMRAAKIREDNAKARAYIAALQAELDMADAALAAIEAGLGKVDAGGNP